VLWAMESCNRITMIRKSVVGVGILQSNNNGLEECVVGVGILQSNNNDKEECCGRWNLAIE
jgi:hypothetical protein